MVYRLLALDVDDTLLDENSSLPEKNKRMVAEALGAGVEVVLVTGRMHISALPYHRLLGLQGPLISYNGALVKEDGQTLRYDPLSPELAERILTLLQGYSLHLNLYLEDSYFVENYGEEVRLYEEISGISAERVDSLFSVLDQAPIKLLIIEPDQELIGQLKTLLQDSFRGQIHLTTSRPGFLEITAAGVNKGRALKWLVEQRGWSPEEVLAIGDGMNDLEMIRYAGLGLVPANASPQLKESADGITLSSSQGGVARAIEEYILKERKGYS